MADEKKFTTSNIPEEKKTEVPKKKKKGDIIKEVASLVGKLTIVRKDVIVVMVKNKTLTPELRRSIGEAAKKASGGFPVMVIGNGTTTAVATVRNPITKSY